MKPGALGHARQFYCTVLAQAVYRCISEQENRQCVQEFVPEVVLLQTEPAVPVRKQLVELLEAAVRAQPSLTALSAVLSTLRQLLDDSSPAVVRRTVAACSIAFRCSLIGKSIIGKSI